MFHPVSLNSFVFCFSQFISIIYLFIYYLFQLYQYLFFFFFVTQANIEQLINLIQNQKYQMLLR